MRKLEQPSAVVSSDNEHINAKLQEYRLDAKTTKAIANEINHFRKTECAKIPVIAISEIMHQDHTVTEHAIGLLKTGEKLLPHKSSNIFDDCVNFSERMIEKAKSTTESHPWLVGTTAVVGTAAIFAATRGYVSRFLNAEKKIDGAAQALEREGILAKVGPIPDVVRPQIESLTASGVPAKFEKAASEYRVSLSALKNLSTHYKMNQSEWFEDIATRALNDRAPITGERVTPENISKELARISALNPETVIPANRQILVHDRASIAKLAEITQFKHVPQLGQFLKQFGVSEESIQDAFKIQSAISPVNRPLLGQILVDNKLALKEQVDHAFEQQNLMKSVLKKIQEESFKNNRVGNELLLKNLNYCWNPQFEGGVSAIVHLFCQGRWYRLRLRAFYCSFYRVNN